MDNDTTKAVVKGAVSAVAGLGAFTFYGLQSLGMKDTASELNTDFNIVLGRLQGHEFSAARSNLEMAREKDFAAGPDDMYGPYAGVRVSLAELEQLAKDPRTTSGQLTEKVGYVGGQIDHLAFTRTNTISEAAGFGTGIGVTLLGVAAVYSALQIGKVLGFSYDTLVNSKKQK